MPRPDGFFATKAPLESRNLGCPRGSLLLRRRSTFHNRARGVGAPHEPVPCAIILISKTLDSLGWILNHPPEIVRISSIDIFLPDRGSRETAHALLAARVLLPGRLLSAPLAVLALQK
jgi:hypothetical protein